MEFKWNRDGLKSGVGGNDAELISQWPGMLYDNTRDYIMWGLWGARQRLPLDPTKLAQAGQLEVAKEMVKDWHPNMRRLLELSDVSTVFSINIRTSVPPEV